MAYARSSGTVRPPTLRAVEGTPAGGRHSKSRDDACAAALVLAAVSSTGPPKALQASYSRDGLSEQ